MKKLGIAIVMIAGLLTGCVHQEFGTKIDPAKVAQIKKNVSSRSDVEALLGPPMNVSMLGNGKRMMTYSYTATEARTTATAFIPLIGNAGEGQTRMQMLQIVLNESGVVEDYELSDKTTKHEIGSALVPIVTEKK